MKRFTFNIEAVENGFILSQGGYHIGEMPVRTRIAPDVAAAKTEARLIFNDWLKEWAKA